jgi:hypothetical protein
MPEKRQALVVAGYRQSLIDTDFQPTINFLSTNQRG